MRISMAPFRLLDLPVELLQIIFRYCLTPILMIYRRRGKATTVFPTALLQTCRAVYNVAAPLITDEIALELRAETIDGYNYWHNYRGRIPEHILARVRELITNVKFTYALPSDLRVFPHLTNVHIVDHTVNLIHVGFGTQIFEALPMNTTEEALAAMQRKVTERNEWDSQQASIGGQYVSRLRVLGESRPTNCKFRVSAQTLHQVHLDWRYSNLPTLSHYNVEDKTAMIRLQFKIDWELSGGDLQPAVWQIKHISLPRKYFGYFDFIGLHDRYMRKGSAPLSDSIEYPVAIENAIAALQILLPQCYKPITI